LKIVGGGKKRGIVAQIGDGRKGRRGGRFFFKGGGGEDTNVYSSVWFQIEGGGGVALNEEGEESLGSESIPILP